MNTDLSLVLPQAEPVTLAGRVLLLGELSFGSYVRLQAFLKIVQPHPLVALEARSAELAAMEPLARHLAIRDAVELFAEETRWPLSPLSAEGRNCLLNLVEGTALIIRLAVEQYGGALAEDEARGIARSMTGDEARQMIRVVFGVYPTESLWTMFYGPQPLGPTVRTDWPRLLAEMRAYPYNLTRADLAAITPTELAMIRSGGKFSPNEAPGGDQSASTENVAELVKAKRAFWRGDHLCGEANGQTPTC